jgi:two-component system nitrate/nitrite response regulator NarL
MSVAMNAHDSSINYEVLSKRERQVMLLAAVGISNKEIARDLNIAEGTIKLHLHRVYQKLGIRSRFALAVAVRNMSSGGAQSGGQRTTRGAGKRSR